MRGVTHRVIAAVNVDGSVINSAVNGGGVNGGGEAVVVRFLCKLILFGIRRSGHVTIM